MKNKKQAASVVVGGKGNIAAIKVTRLCCYFLQYI